MPSHRLVREIGAAAGICVALTVLSACGDDDDDSDQSGTTFGPSQQLGGGVARTYATLGDDGKPTEVGVRLTTKAVEELPETGELLMLAFPDEAAETGYDHVMLNWNPQGHEPPGLFDKPHFDLHFDMVGMEAIQSVDPADPNYAAMAEHAPDPKYVPQDYALPPGPPAAQQAVPNMGVHLADSTDTTLIPGSYDFEQVMIHGYWDGRYTFVEPMITREYLLTKPTLDQPLKLPQAYHESGYYATTWHIGIDEETGEYLISLGGMTERTAS